MQKFYLVIFLSLLINEVICITSTPFHLNILHTSFLDGRVTELTPVGGFPAGGFARIKTFYTNTITENGFNSTLLLNSYNFLGTDLFFQEFKNTNKLALYANQVGYQYIGLGTGELFYGSEPLRNFLSAGNFTMLCSHVDVRNSHPLFDLIKKSVIHSAYINGEMRKIGLIGLTDEALCLRTSCDLVLTPKSIASTLPAVINALKADGVDLIIAVSGAGFAADTNVAATIDNIDIIVSNIHNMTAEYGNYPTVVLGPSGKNVLIVATLGQSDSIGSLNITVQNGVITHFQGDCLSLDACSNDAAPTASCTVQNTTILAEINADNNLLAIALNRTVGYLTIPTPANTGSVCKLEECLIGDIVTDAVRWRMAGVCDIAFINGGSVRAGLSAGNVTMRSIFESFPFSNNIASFILTGADLIDVFQYSVTFVGEVGDSGKFLQVSGVHLLIDPDLPPGQKVVRIRVEDRYKQLRDIEPSQLYYVCSNNFLRMSGDGYGMIQTKAVQADDNGPPLTTTLGEYFTQFTPVTPVLDGRISLVNSTEVALTPVIGTTCVFTQTLTAQNSTYVDPCGFSGAFRSKTLVNLILSPPNRTLDNAIPRFFALHLPALVLESGDSLSILKGTSETIATYRQNGNDVLATFSAQTPIPSYPIYVSGKVVTVRFQSNNVRPPYFSAPAGVALGLDVTYESFYTCAPGFAINSTGSCAPCSPGTYSGINDNTCQPCPVGTASDLYGVISCPACPSGTYQPETNQTSCLACSGGRVSLTTSVCACTNEQIFNGNLCVSLRERGDSVKSIFYAVNTLLILICLALWAYLVKRKDFKVFRSASPLFLQLALLGTIFALIAVYMAFATPSKAVCTAYNWFFHIGFVLAFGALYLKTTRISAILHVKDAGPVKLSDKVLSIRLGLLLLVMIAYLIIWTVIGSPDTELVVTSSDYFFLCVDNWWNNGTLIGELVFVVFGVYLAFRVRKAPSAFNEARLIGFSVYNWLALSVVLNIVRLTTPSTLDGVPALQCLVVFLTFFVTVCVLFMPKVYMVVIGKGNAVQWNTMGSTAKAQKIADNVEQRTPNSTSSAPHENLSSSRNNLVAMDDLRKNSIVAQALAKADIMEEEVTKLQRTVKYLTDTNRELEIQVRSLGGKIAGSPKNEFYDSHYSKDMGREESEMA